MQVQSAALLVILAWSAGSVHAQPAPAGAQTQTPPVATAPGSAQAPATTTAPNEAAAAAPAVTASSVLQPSLTQTQTVLSTLKIDHWKKGSVREEAGDNVNALLRDLQTNLPPLLTAADAEPGALSRAVPLIKHLDAFYDVLLRVEEASRVSGPSDQVSALQQTMLDVNKARIAYDDLLQAQASSQEKQVFAMRTEVQAQKETIAAQQVKVDAAAAVQPCKPATPAHRKRRTTSTTKPGTSTKTTPTPKPQ